MNVSSIEGVRAYPPRPGVRGGEGGGEPLHPVAGGGVRTEGASAWSASRPTSRTPPRSPTTTMCNVIHDGSGGRRSVGSGTPEDQADVIVALASDQFRFVTGAVVNTDGGTGAAGGWFWSDHAGRFVNRPDGLVLSRRAERDVRPRSGCLVTSEMVASAADALAGRIVDTPCAASPALSELTGATVWVKLENFQRTGSFKDRGALNRLLALDPAEQRTWGGGGIGGQSRTGRRLPRPRRSGCPRRSSSRRARPSPRSRARSSSAPRSSSRAPMSPRRMAVTARDRRSRRTGARASLRRPTRDRGSGDGRRRDHARRFRSATP